MDITMGNDEFILYIRKKQLRLAGGDEKKKKIMFPKDIRNNLLGQEIWSFIRNISDITKEPYSIQEDEPCMWNTTTKCDNDGHELPKTAAQITFNIFLLPAIYKKLDELVDRMR